MASPSRPRPPLIPTRLRLPLLTITLLLVYRSLSTFSLSEYPSLSCEDHPQAKGCEVLLDASETRPPSTTRVVVPFGSPGHGTGWARHAGAPVMSKGQEDSLIEQHEVEDEELERQVEKWRPTESNVLNLTRDDWPVPTTVDPEARYLSYLPHSGFHNQRFVKFFFVAPLAELLADHPSFTIRLALINALTIAKMTNRILLVPPITLGSAVAWVPPPLLQEHLEQAENSDMAECRKLPLAERKEKCGLFWKSRRASWSWLLGSSLSSRQPLISRPYHHRSWFTTALSLLPHEIFSIPDPDRRSYQLLDTDDPDPPSADNPYTYTENIYIEDLLGLSNYRLLEFGSLFGGTRLRLKKRENKKFYKETQKLMAYRDPMLEAMSEAVVERLGGRGNFVGLHLRLGGRNDFVANSDAFYEEAEERTDLVFRTLCAEEYGLPDLTISALLALNRRRSAEEDLSPSTLQPPSPPHHLSKTLTCPSALYPPNTPLATLNTPLYIATDGMNPRSDHLTALFRNTFPCMFFLSDFQSVNSLNTEEIPEIAFLARAMDPNGESLRPFLEPFLEGEVAAKAKGVVGSELFYALVSMVHHDTHLLLQQLLCQHSPHS
ncbi:hypothetical protein P7C70_g2019, partial [Phenoliferia sp. Uapishka_3]